MAEFSELWAIGMLLAAFAGGAFGASIGALPAFIFTGFLVMAGESVNIASAELLELLAVDAELGNTTSITGMLGFGPVFGPHISFAAGAAATAFASQKGYMDTEFPYHQGKNILFAHGPKPDVMVVGGLFGILGYWIATISTTLALPWDPIALAVVVSAIAHRLAFGFPVIGDHKKGLLNMKPFEDGTLRGPQAARDKGAGRDKTADREPVAERDPEDREPGGEEVTGRMLVEPWLGHQYKWGHVTLLGAIVGVLAAVITYETGSVFLPFGISAATLLFLNLGIANIPVTHHMSLVASTAVVAATGGTYAQEPLILMLLLGGLFGVLAAVFGEWVQRIFYAHSDTHLDPPAAAILLGTLLIALLAIAGVFPSASWVPTLGMNG